MHFFFIKKQASVLTRLIVLLLLDAGQSGSLTVCPSDVVATTSECVLIRVAGKPGSSLRWYRNNSTHGTVIFTGAKMDYNQVDWRYFVTGSRGEEKNLNIRDVKSMDAGQFTVREEFSRQSASINLVVIGKLSLLVLVVMKCFDTTVTVVVRTANEHIDIGIWEAPFSGSSRLQHGTLLPIFEKSQFITSATPPYI